MTRDQLCAELLGERFGPPPVAELGRPPARDFGAGGPDSPESGAFRLHVLGQALSSHPERSTA